MVTGYISQGAGFMDHIEYNIQDLEELDRILALNNVTTLDAIEYLHQPCSELLFRCRYEYKLQPCDLLFQRTMTYHGVCCTFNGIKVTQHFLEATRFA